MPLTVLAAWEQRGPGHLGAKVSMSDISTWHSQGSRPDPGQSQTIFSGSSALPCSPAPKVWHLRPKPSCELLQGWSWKLRAKSRESPAALGSPGLPGHSQSTQPRREGAGGQSWHVGVKRLSHLLSLRLRAGCRGSSEGRLSPWPSLLGGPARRVVIMWQG